MQQCFEPRQCVHACKQQASKHAGAGACMGAGTLVCPAVMTSPARAAPQVFVRVRPLNEREREMGGHKCVQQPSAQSVRVLTSEPQLYTFDTVAGEAADQASFFAGLGGALMHHACVHSACQRVPLTRSRFACAHPCC